MSHQADRPERRCRWYFGGLSSSIAVCITHPLDMVKVLLQTQQTEGHSAFELIAKVYHHKGLLGFYSGISASLTRQMTYSTARFGLYETGKPYIDHDKFSSKLILAGAIGVLASFIGIPTDVVNVRMQNDTKLPPAKRRNYTHVFNGLIRIYREEGIRQLFTGASFGVARGVFITIGQNAGYDHVKMILKNSFSFKEGIPLHFIASLSAGVITTTLAQPLDVLKTRSMNAPPGKFASIWSVIIYTAHEGPLAFFKGYVPSFIRIGPHTVILYLIMEQLRMHYGIIVNPREEK